MMPRVLFFVLVGPAVGTVCLASIALITNLFFTSKLFENLYEGMMFVALMFSVGALGGYLTGILPALVAALLFSLFLSKGLNGWRLNTTLAFACGGTTQVIVMNTFLFAHPFAAPDEPLTSGLGYWFSETAFALGTTGAVSASVCSALRQRRERARRATASAP